MSTMKPIRTAEDHAAALAEIEGLMGAAPGSSEAERLEVLAVLVAEYERRGFEDPPPPEDILEAAMYMQGRTQAELSTVLGSRARASEVLGRRRGLSAEQAERLADAWRLPLRLLGGGAGAKRRARGAAVAAVAVTVVLGGVAAGVFADAGRDLPDIAPVVQAAAPGPHRVDVRSLPAHVYQAVVAAQDARFFAHGGYDGAAIVRAAGSDLAPTQWSRPAGGSTLTQQLAKSVLLKDEPRGVRRKIRELLLARRIEARLDKEEVLNAWLNSVYFGGGVTGLTGAAGAYFDVAPQDLTISQAAYLAGLPNAPERLRLDRAENRLEAVVTRDRIVQRMVREGYVTPVVAGRIAGESLTPVS